MSISKPWNFNRKYRKFQDIRVGNDFLDMTLKSQLTKAKIDK